MSSNFLNTLLFALLGVMAFRYFFSPTHADFKSLESRVDVSGQVFHAPVSQLETRPINKEIDFLDTKIPSIEEEVILDTPLCEYSFSSRNEEKTVLPYTLMTFSSVLSPRAN